MLPSFHWNPLSHSESPPVIDVFLANSPVGEVSADEVSSIFLKEPVFAKYFASIGGDTEKKEAAARWLDCVAAAISRQALQAPAEETAVEVVFGFPGAYGPIGHIAIAVMSRSGSRELQACFSHQESIPKVIDGKKVVRGKVGMTFDTSEYFGGQKPPILKSIEAFGLPAVAARSCQNGPPELQRLILTYLGCEHPYGYKGEIDKEQFTSLTCFSISQTIHRFLHGYPAEINVQATVPNGVADLLTMIFGYDAYKRICDVPVDGKLVSPSEISDEHIKQAFLHYGSRWIANMPWDVPPSGLTLKPRF